MHLLPEGERPFKQEMQVPRFLSKTLQLGSIKVHMKFFKKNPSLHEEQYVPV